MGRLQDQSLFLIFQQSFGMQTKVGMGIMLKSYSFLVENGTPGKCFIVTRAESGPGRRTLMRLDPVANRCYG